MIPTHSCTITGPSDVPIGLAEMAAHSLSPRTPDEPAYSWIKTSMAAKGLSTDERIVGVLVEGGEMTTASISRLLEMSYNQVRMRLLRMQRKGLVCKGPKYGGKWFVKGADE